MPAPQSAEYGSVKNKTLQEYMKAMDKSFAYKLFDLIDEIHSLIKNNDLGKEFYKRLISTEHKIRLLDLDNINNNDFAIVDELPFSVKEGTEEGSFRPDINILVNGMPLAFLEVKHPDNSGGIQVEFERMINKRLKNNDYKKYFNLIQIISFSNNNFSYSFEVY
mgnify:CR=1 FL=1